MKGNPVEFVDIVLAILNVVTVILTLFLIGIILIQRGKGGGLAGAFGGMGGSSAFGTKTGDVFTKITVGVAMAWILLSMLMVVLTNRRNTSAWGNDPATSITKELGASGKSKAKDKDKAKATDDILIPSPTKTSGAGDSQAPVNIPAIPDMPLPSESPLPGPK
jgi:preprotein translocase subunit SecG